MTTPTPTPTQTPTQFTLTPTPTCSFTSLSATPSTSFSPTPSNSSIITEYDKTFITLQAGEDLGGNRTVVFNALGEAIYADNTINTHAERIIGITTHSALQGEDVLIQCSGVMREPSWNWDIDSVLYQSTSGLLTQTIPVTGFIQQIANSLSPTEIYWDTGEAYFQ